MTFHQVGFQESLYIYIPRTQMTHTLKDLTHEMEGQPPQKEVSWVQGINILGL